MIRAVVELSVKYLTRIGLGVMICALGIKAAAAVTVNVGVFEDQLVFFEQLLSESDCPAYQQSAVGENQMLMEYLAICHQIQRSLPDTRFKLVGYPVVPRLLDGLVKNEVDVSGFGVWSGESEHPSVIRSVPLMPIGMFSKGLYVNDSTFQRLNSADDFHFNQLIAVSNENWTFDWQALECAGLKLVHVDRYEQMFQLLALGRADVLPMAFGAGTDLTRTEFGIQLYPIDGLKLVIPDSSHVLISTNSKLSKQLVDVINTGLTGVHQSGELMQWYAQTGVINPLTSNWTSICPR